MNNTSQKDFNGKLSKYKSNYIQRSLHTPNQLANIENKSIGNGYGYGYGYDYGYEYNYNYGEDYEQEYDQS